MEIIVRTKSLMLETLAFSKGDIFMLIVLANLKLNYLCILMKKPGE
jgi:hypothetical protein